MSEPYWNDPPEPPAEYLAAIRRALKEATDKLADEFGADCRWTDEQLDDYRDCGGWGDYYEAGYSPAEAVVEDMTYWTD